MSPTPPVTERPAATALARPRPRRQQRHSSVATDPGRHASREARQRAAVLLEVLAGARSPAQAAAALGLSLPRYYQVEVAALRGLVAACEPVPRGQGRAAEAQLRSLQKEQQRLQRELARQQALVRLSQRTLGLPPPTPPPASKNAGKGKKKPRRRTARALRVAARLQQPPAEEPSQGGPAGSS